MSTLTKEKKKQTKKPKKKTKVVNKTGAKNPRLKKKLICIINLSNMIRMEGQEETALNSRLLEAQLNRIAIKSTYYELSN